MHGPGNIGRRPAVCLQECADEIVDLFQSFFRDILICLRDRFIVVPPADDVSVTAGVDVAAPLVFVCQIGAEIANSLQFHRVAIDGQIPHVAAGRADRGPDLPVFIRVGVSRVDQLCAVRH